MEGLEELKKWSNGLLSDEAARAILNALKGEEGKELKLWELGPKSYGYAKFSLEAYSPLSYKSYITACISQRAPGKVIHGYLKVEGIGEGERGIFDKFLEKEVEVRGVLGEYMSSWLGGIPLLRASLPESRFKILGKGSLTTPSDLYKMLSENPRTSENCFNVLTGFILGGKCGEWKGERTFELKISDLRSVAVLRFRGGDAERVYSEISKEFKVPEMERWEEGAGLSLKAYGTIYPYTVSFYPPLRFYVPRGRGGRPIPGWVRGEGLNSMRGQKISIEGASRKLEFLRVEEGIYKFGFLGRVSDIELMGRGAFLSILAGNERINLKVFGDLRMVSKGDLVLGFWPERWSEESRGLLSEELVSGLEGEELEIEGLEAFSDYIFLKVLKQF